MKARLSTVLTVVIFALASATAIGDFRPSPKFKSIGPALQRLNAVKREIRNSDVEGEEASKDINFAGGFPILHPDSGFDPNPDDDSSETFGPINNSNTTTAQSTSTEKTTPLHVSVEESTTTSHTSTEKTTPLHVSVEESTTTSHTSTEKTTPSHVSVEESTTTSHTSTEKTTPSHVSVEDTTTTSHTSTEKTTPSHVSVEDTTTTSHTSTEKTTPSHISVEETTITSHTSTKKTTPSHTSTTETSFDEIKTSRKTTTTTAYTTEADVQTPPPAVETVVEGDEYDGEDSDDEYENEDEENDDDEDEDEDEDDDENEDEDDENADSEEDDDEDDEKEDDYDSSEEDSSESSEEKVYTSENVSEEEEVRVPLNSNDRGTNSQKTYSPEKKKKSNFICLYPGRFRDPFDCRKYYVCREVLNPKVKVIPYLYRCPDNTWYSNYFKKCVRFKPGICRDASA